MKIGELSKITGASIRSIRHYEKQNLLTAKRMDNGYREFDDTAIERIQTIQIYLGLGLTTKQIEEIFSCHEEEPTIEYDEFCEEMQAIYQEKLDEIDHKMETLTIVKQRLAEQLHQFTKSTEKMPASKHSKSGEGS